MEMNLEKINSFYKSASLFDGFFDGKTVRYNKCRHHWNSFVFITMETVALFHLIIFLTNEEKLKNELIYLRFSKDYAARFINLGNVSHALRVKVWSQRTALLSYHSIFLYGNV